MWIAITFGIIIITLGLYVAYKRADVNDNLQKRHHDAHLSMRYKHDRKNHKS